MIPVIDASTVVHYLLRGADEREPSVLLGSAHAPAFVDVEVTHVLRGFLRGRKLTADRAITARQDLAALTLERHPDVALLEGAWRLRDVCSVYDGLYVALAQALGATLVTRDLRLARGVSDLVDVMAVD